MSSSMLVSRFARRKAFTLVELMIVVIIVAILAMVAIPLYRSSIDDARMTEGISGVGTINTACRVRMATGGLGSVSGLADLGFTADDLKGKYFTIGNYDLSVSDPNYTITVTDPETGLTYSIDQDGVEGGTYVRPW